MLLEPKSIEVNGRQFIISKFPAVEGREIISGYPMSAMPKLGDYKRNEEIMQKMMNYVAAISSGVEIRLTNTALINNHTGSWETLVKLEGLMLEYNCSFLANGQVSGFLQNLASNVTDLISKISTAYLGRLSQNKFASLKELKTVYTLEDAFTMWEVLAVTRYNEYLASKPK